MPRVLLVAIPADADPQAFSTAARALRDAGHEVVHGGVIGSPEQVAAVASQEDVDVVLVIGESEAESLAEQLPSGEDEPAVRVLHPGVARADVLAATEG